MQGGPPSGASPPAAPSPAADQSPAAPQAKQKASAEELLAKLRAAFAEKGKVFEEGWRVEVKHRTTGTSAGTCDVYYYAPSGKRYRSRMEIARDFGLEPDNRPPKSGNSKPRKRSGAQAAAAGAAAAVPAEPRQPLSREQAYEAAKQRFSAVQLPMVLHNGVRVISLGTVRPGPHYHDTHHLWPAGYTTEWTDEKGVRFISSITETPQGPAFRVQAQRTATEERAASEIVEVGTGHSPDAAWSAAVERQQEALEIFMLAKGGLRKQASHPKHGGHGHGSGSDGAAAGHPGYGGYPSQQQQQQGGEEGDEGGGGSRALDAVDKLLLKSRPLEGCWGTEQFGLASVDVLQAIEGLPHADECAAYVFVESRSSWEAEFDRLQKELIAHGRTPAPARPGDKRKASEAGGVGGNSAARPPRPKRPRPSKAEAEINAVRRVLDSMIRQIEVTEIKAASAEHKARLKQERDLQRLMQKEEKRMQKEREREILERLQSAQYASQHAAWLEERKRIEEANRTHPDETLPGASEPPPEPAPLASGALAPAQQPVLLEAWHFCHRFGEALGLSPAQVPTLGQLEAALVSGSLYTTSSRGSKGAGAASVQAGGEGGAGTDEDKQVSAAVRLQSALLDFLVKDLFAAAVFKLHEANQDVTVNDLKPNARAEHPLPLGPDTWQEVARRYLTILAATAAAHGAEGGSGTVFPLARLDAAAVLQFLTAGPPPELHQGEAALHRGGAAAPAAAAAAARQDAAAIAAAETAFYRQPAEAEAQRQDMQRVLRCILGQVAHQASRKDRFHTLSSGGQAAAAAAKSGRPLDLQMIGARVDAGVYTALPDPLEAFAADVRHVVQLFQTACNKSSSAFAAAMADRGAEQTAALAENRLDNAIQEVRQCGVEDYLAQHARVSRRQQQAADAAAPAGAAQQSREPSQQPTGPPPAAAGQEQQAVPAADVQQQQKEGPSVQEMPGQQPVHQQAVADGDQGTPPPPQPAAQEQQLQPHEQLQEGRSPSAQQQGTPASEPSPQQQLPDSAGASAALEKTDAIRDLDRPFCPWHEACCVCWGTQDPEHIITCASCDCYHHTYCLDPPLQTAPTVEEHWRCPRCRRKAGEPASTAAEPPRFARGSGADEAWELAQLLGRCDWRSWGVEARCRLLSLLCCQAAESHALHEIMQAGEDEVKEKRKEITGLKHELKALQQEVAAAAAPPGSLPPGAAAAAALPGSPGSGGAVSPGPKLSTRTTRSRDPGAAIEERTLRISKLEHDLTQVGPVRLDPAGIDRHYHRYYQLPAAALEPAAGTAVLSSPPEDRPPVLVVERHHLDSVEPAGAASNGSAAAAAAVKAGAAGSREGEAGRWQVGVYADEAALQALLGWLNPKGHREKALAAEVRKLLAQHQAYELHRQEAQALTARGSGGLAPMDLDSPLPTGAAAAAIGQQRCPAPAVPAPAAVQASLEAEVERLRRAMIDFEDGFQPNSRDELRGSEQRRADWRALVAAAATPQALMTCLLVLEGMLQPQWLKPHWRPWCCPAPHPQHTATLPAVWLRFEALKSALKLKVALKFNPRELLGNAAIQAAVNAAGGRYALREARPVAKPWWETADLDANNNNNNAAHGPPTASHGNSGGRVAGESRADRAARRAREVSGEPQSDEDEEYARQLDAELNAGALRTRHGVHPPLFDGGLPQHQQHAHGSRPASQHGSEEEEEWEDEEEDEAEDSGGGDDYVPDELEED